MVEVASLRSRRRAGQGRVALVLQLIQAADQARRELLPPLEFSAQGFGAGEGDGLLLGVGQVR